MALARVVMFEGVSADRMDQMKQNIEEGDRPDEIPATEIVVLQDRDSEKAAVILFFENEDDYKRGDEFLSAMPAEETPGRRASVSKYDVAVRRSA